MCLATGSTRKVRQCKKTLADLSALSRNVEVTINRRSRSYCPRCQKQHGICSGYSTKLALYSQLWNLYWLYNRWCHKCRVKAGQPISISHVARVPETFNNNPAKYDCTLRLPLADCWHLSDDHCISTALLRRIICSSAALNCNRIFSHKQHQ